MSVDTSSSRAAIHMVSAWACDQKLVLGQRKVDDKSNEIMAIPELLELLKIKGGDPGIAGTAEDQRRDRDH